MYRHVCVCLKAGGGSCCRAENSLSVCGGSAYMCVHERVLNHCSMCTRVVFQPSVHYVVSLEFDKVIVLDAQLTVHLQD